MRQMVSWMVIALGCILLLSQVAEAQLMRIDVNNEQGCFAHTDKEEYKKFGSYISQDDKEAFNKALFAARLRGTATVFYKGEEVYLVDSSWPLLKVRRKGETEEYWIFKEYVKD